MNCSSNSFHAKLMLYLKIKHNSDIIKNDSIEYSEMIITQ